MTAEDVFHARLMASVALAAVVGTAIHAGRAPALTTSVPPPFVVWRRVSAVRESAFDGPSDVQRGRFQVDCFAGTYARAVEIAGLVEAALTMEQDADLWAEKAGEFDMFDDDRPAMWRRTMDFLTAERMDYGR